MRHYFIGLLWISLYLVLTLFPLAIILIGQTLPKRDFWSEFAIGLGFIGLALMCLQFVLTARFKHLKAPYGSDIVYNFHRDIALIGAVLILAHPLILAFTPLRPEVLIRFDLLGHPFFPRWGFYAALFMLAVVVTSVWRQQLKISYETWRRLHAVFAILAVLLAILHITTENHYLAEPLKRALWLTYMLLWLGLIAWIRLIKPWTELRRPYVIQQVKPERGNARTLELAPLRHQGFRFAPGQFAWITLFDSPFTDREHPFSISGSAARAPQLEFTIKELGDFTRRVGRARPGDKVYVDGPFGALSADRHPRAAGFVLIAGGIGITPMMSHLRTFADRGEKRPLLLIYANNEWESVTFREEIEALRLRLNLTVVHVLVRPPKEWHGETGFVTDRLLKKYLPDPTARYEYFICGPPVMNRLVEKALHRLGISAGNVHSERFNLA